MDYRKYIGKKAILASKNTRVVGVIDNDGSIRGHVICGIFDGDGGWVLGWHLSDMVDPRSRSCDRDGFILAIDGVAIYKTPKVKEEEKLMAEFHLRKPTLYDLL